MRSNGSTMHAVFVHGAGGGGWEWAIWQRVFAARGAAVRAPDLQPASGGLAATRLADYAAQVTQWCAGCADPLLLVGASLGGLLALLVAPEVKPDALVLVNPLPPAGSGQRPARAYPDIVPWGTDRSLRSTLRALPDGDDAARLLAFRRWRDDSGGVLRAAQGGVDIVAPDCPVLLLAAERDVDVPLAASRALAARFAAELDIIAGASHLGPLLGRDAAAVAERAWTWCERVIGRSVAASCLELLPVRGD